MSISVPCARLATRSLYCHLRASSTLRSPRSLRHVTRPSTMAPVSTGAQLRHSPSPLLSKRATTSESRDRMWREVLSLIATLMCSTRIEMATMCPLTLLLMRTAQGPSSHPTRICPSTPSLVTSSDTLRPTHRLSFFGRHSSVTSQTVLRL